MVQLAQLCKEVYLVLLVIWTVLVILFTSLVKQKYIYDLQITL